MASLKLILRINRSNSKGEHPLYLRIISNRKTAYKALGIYILEKDWDEDLQKVRRSYPNSVRLNNFLATKFLEFENQYFDIAKTTQTIDAKAIKLSFTKSNRKTSMDFFAYMAKHLDLFENQEMVASHQKMKAVETKLKEFHGSKLLFEEITVDFLERFRNYLLNDLGNSINTVYSNLAKIRLLFNSAVREELITDGNNPFKKFRLKWENTTKEFLTEDELNKIETLELNPGHQINHHRNMYVFATYVGGLRISDLLLLKWKNFDGEIITLTIKKTGTQISVKVPKKGLEILDFYKSKYNGKEGNFIFPFLSNLEGLNQFQVTRAISSATAYANKNLRIIAQKAGVNKKITFHTSRHTFATRALKKGMPITHVSKVMGHAQLRETMVYAKIVNEDLNKAMEVFDAESH